MQAVAVADTAYLGIRVAIAARAAYASSTAREIVTQALQVSQRLGPATPWYVKVPVAVYLALRPYAVQAARTAAVAATIAWKVFRY